MDEIDTLTAMFDDHDAGPDARGTDDIVEADVGDLLGSFGAGGKQLVGGPGGGGGAGQRQPAQLAAQPPEFPEPTLAMPPEVFATAFGLIGKFHLRCEVDLRQIAFALRNAEYNPRKQESLTLRLQSPRTTVLMRSSGACTILSASSEEQLRRSARKVVKLVQKCGLPDARLDNYDICSIGAKVDLGFPVRLEQLAAKWRRHALYEPELYCGCVFRMRSPKATFQITAGGKMTIMGLKRMEHIHDCLRRIYPILFEFRH